MFSHHPSHPTTLGPWRNHEGGIRYVGPQPRLVGLENISADYFLLRQSDIAPGLRAAPVSQCLLTGNVRIEGISIGSANDRMKDSPNGFAVFSSRATDSQRVWPAVATSASRARHRIFCCQSETISPIFQRRVTFSLRTTTDRRCEIREDSGNGMNFTGKSVTLMLPEIGMIALTRGALGVGIGLLLSNSLNKEERQSAGLALLAVGVLTTIPLLLRLRISLKKRSCAARGRVA